MLGPDEFLVNELVKRERDLRLLGPTSRLVQLLNWQLATPLFLVSLVVGWLVTTGVGGPWQLIMYGLWAFWLFIVVAFIAAFIAGWVRWRRDRVGVEEVEAALRRLAALQARFPEVPVTDPVTLNRIVAFRADDGARTVVVAGPDGPDHGLVVEYRLGEYGVGYRIFVNDDEELPADAMSLGDRVGGESRDFLVTNEVEELAAQLERSLR